MKSPEILKEQEPIIEWAKSLRNTLYLNKIIMILVDSKEIKELKDDDSYLRARKLYRKYNSSWKDQILMAITIGHYAFVNDFKEGAIVTNNDLIGFARHIDNVTREFSLYSSSYNNTLIGRFKISDFEKVF